MKIRKNWPIYVVLLLFLLLFIYFFTFKEITYQEGRSLLFLTLPSPPQAKIITDKEEIQSIIALLNDSSRFGHGLSGLKGWIGEIQYNGSTYIIQNESTIEHNRVLYKLSEDKVARLFEVYKKSSAPEEPFTDDTLIKFNKGK